MLSLFFSNLKCENLLLDKHNKLMVSDCGFTRAQIRQRGAPSSPSSSYVGKAEYATPEVLQGISSNALSAQKSNKRQTNLIII